MQFAQQWGKKISGRGRDFLCRCGINQKTASESGIISSEVIKLHLVVELPAPDEEPTTAEGWAEYVALRVAEGENVHMAVETDLE